jgi:hypothetical protein
MKFVPPLDPARWRALSPYLDQALEMSREDRAAWLAHICASDPALGADLERLLAEHDHLQRSRFLEPAVPPPDGSTEPR